MLFFHQPHPKGVLKGNTWETARICEQMNWCSLARSGSAPADGLILISEKPWPFPQPVPVLGTDSNETFRNLGVEIFNLTDLQSTIRCG